MNFKWITILASAMMLIIAVACEKPARSSNDDEIPPHVTPPEEEVEVEVSYDKAEGVIRLLSYNVGAFSKENHQKPRNNRYTFSSIAVCT